tara:strand:+ start:1485 stop:3044 length:1560 start_codon:yes stop_codon:yes gene_type:complete
MINNNPINKSPLKIRRALISVYDKTDILDLAESLVKADIEILSTGGTEKTLRKSNIPVINVSDYTNFPEIMDGRVKTINPLIEGGILGFRDSHLKEAEKHKIKWIDLVICNLYPFAKTIMRRDCNLSLALENIDIGGPTMIRSAAKNLGWVCVAVDPNDYKKIGVELLESNSISFDLRKTLSTKAFAHTAQYDVVIHNYLKEEKLPDKISFSYNKHSNMRYGENPNQQAAAYQMPEAIGNNILNSKIHQGKPLSYNNIMDADAALNCIKEFDSIACVVVKHANPCGVSIGQRDIAKVFKRAFNADKLSSFGGVVALNKTCNKQIAEELSKVFVEIVVAPHFDIDALRILKRKKNLRVLSTGKISKRENDIELRNIDGGVLVQDVDTSNISQSDLQHVTNKKVSEKDVSTMLFGWKVLKHIKSNAILTVKNHCTIGVGAGQVSRVDAVDIAVKKSGENIKGSILCSDAFFPFRDSIDRVSGKGIKAIIQPGGSIRDNEVIEACNEYNIAMVFTGKRCFKH